MSTPLVLAGPTAVAKSFREVPETKSHAGVVDEHSDGVWLNGRRMYRDPRRQARAGAMAVAGLLKRETGNRRWVEELVCFPSATVSANGHQVEARVVGTRQLLSRLRLAPTRLDCDERDRLVAVLNRVK